LGQKIINLSEKDLTDIEIKLLLLGVKFTPTPNADRVNLIADTDEFCRKLRRKENSSNEDKSLVRNKKEFRHSKPVTNI
jgi:hypothetical protein